MVIMDTDLEGLQTELSIAYTNFFQVLKQLEPGKRSESGVSGHWSPKDVLSHLIGWDKSVQEFIADPNGFNPNPLYDTNTFNAKSVLERQHQSWEETIDELQSSYVDLQKAITTVTAEMKIYDRVSEWLNGRREDYEFHTSQMKEWIKLNGKASK
jgi:uncharacterized protein DUF1706